MRRVLALVLMVGVSAVASAQVADSAAVTTVPVFAHYADWWTVPGSWATAATMPLRQDNPGGGYTSANPDIITAQNAEMIANGIVPLVSYWARDSYAGDAFLNLYLSIPGPKIGILYEAVGPNRMVANNDTVSLADPKNADMFVSDMEHLQAEFFDKYPDRFFRIDGRPVVFVWITQAFRGPFDQVVARARTKSAFYLIGSEFSVPFSERPDMLASIRGMDAITSYGFYDPARYGADIPPDFLKDYSVAFTKWSLYLGEHAPNVRIIAPMGFAYDETRIPGRRGIHFGSSFQMARAYAEMVRSLAANPCGGRALPYAYITSYTEHAEGTAIEPTHEFGSGYLDIIRETFLTIPQLSDADRRQQCKQIPGDGGKE